MKRLIRTGWAVLVVCFVLGFLQAGWAGDAVPFSGKVKKVIAKRNKVAIKDEVKKKRFTVVINEESKLTGYGGIGDIRKGDQVEGKYVVTDKGLYIATEFTKK